MLAHSLTEFSFRYSYFQLLARIHSLLASYLDPAAVPTAVKKKDQVQFLWVMSLGGLEAINKIKTLNLASLTLRATLKSANIPSREQDPANFRITVITTPTTILDSSNCDASP
jgi:hypothetical protein